MGERSSFDHWFFFRVFRNPWFNTFRAFLWLIRPPLCPFVSPWFRPHPQLRRNRIQIKHRTQGFKAFMDWGFYFSSILGRFESLGKSFQALRRILERGAPRRSRIFNHGIRGAHGREERVFRVLECADLAALWSWRLVAKRSLQASHFRWTMGFGGASVIPVKDDGLQKRSERLMPVQPASG